MSEGIKLGTHNSQPGGRVGLHDRSILNAKRTFQPQVRRSIDGFVLQKKLISNDTSIRSQPLPISNPKSTTVRTVRIVHNIKPALPRQARSAVLTRQVMKTKSKKRKHRITQNSRISILLVSMAVLIVIAGGALSYIGWKTNKKTVAQVNVLSSSTNNEGSGEAPIEQDITPDVFASYQVAPDAARYIKIPRLQVNARIKHLGVKPNGVLEAPTNVNDVGWYKGSSKPGENGTVLLDGHVHGPTKQGVFYRLGNLKAGDTIEIERGDGKLFVYKVVTSESVDQDKVDMAKALSSIEPGKPGLNLITCTSRYDINTNKYEQRLIVYAVQQ